MPEFRPLNLAQLYRGADQAVASAMQANLMVLQSSKLKQEFDEENQLRELARSSTTAGPDGAPSFDLKAFTRGAYAVNPMKAIGFEKARADAEKASLDRENLQGQIDERRFKQGAERLRFLNEASTAPFMKYKELVDGGMPDDEARQKVQPVYEQAILSLRNSGMFTNEQLSKFKITPQFDPVLAEGGMRQVLGAKEELAEFWNKKNFGLKEKEFKQRGEQHADTLKVRIRGQDVTVRGQNLTDARAKEDLAVKGLDVKENEDGTYSVVDKKTGQATPALDENGQPLKGTKGRGTDTERMSAGYANRMIAAEEILNGISAGDQKPGKTEAAIGTVPLVGNVIANALRGDDRQKALQAQKDWVRSKLRKESGAVIADEEMAEEIRTYFPQIGDGDEVIKQKAEARKRANEGMIQNAGRAYKGTAKPDVPKVQSFATEAEAEAAAKAGKIKAGDKIKVGNQTGTWR